MSRGRAFTSPTLALVATGLVAGAARCGAESDVAEVEVSIRVDVRDPFGVRPDDDLRVALLWTTTGTVYGSRPVTLRRNENTVELPLRFPDPGEVAEQDLLFSALNLTQQQIPIHVPRIAVYRDDDGSPGFGPWNLEEPPPDRLFAVNAQGATSVVGTIRFPVVLTELVAEDVNTYYAFTGGLHTPFVRFQGATSSLTPDLLTAIGGPPIASLYLDDSGIPARDVRCLNSARFDEDPELVLIRDTGTASRAISLVVDDRLDVPAVCGLGAPECVGADVTTVTPTIAAPRRTPGRRTFTQCRRSASFEVLVTLQAELRCNDCQCRWREQHYALVVPTSSVPVGWPCGRFVDYCESDLPLFRADEVCEAEKM